jgi:hypothetical protein
MAIKHVQVGDASYLQQNKKKDRNSAVMQGTCQKTRKRGDNNVSCCFPSSNAWQAKLARRAALLHAWGV